MQGALKSGCFARLDGDHERQCVGRVARLLHDGANIDLLLGQRGGDGGDDAGAVLDKKSNVMGNFKLGAEPRRG